MATEADIPAPICETRMEQGGNMIDQATNISNNKLVQEEKTPADTVEGEEFLTTPSVDEVHCEVNKTSPDAINGTEKPDQSVKDDTVILLLRNPELDDLPLEIAANDDTSSERVQQNAEESNGSDKEEDRGVLPLEYSGKKAGDIIHHTDLDDVRVETQLSKDTRDGKTTEDDISCNLTGDASKEGECDHNKMTSEWVGLSNEFFFADNVDIAAEKASQENITFVETVTRVTSGDEHQGKNELNSSFYEEEDISIKKGDRVVTTTEDSGIQLENTVKECHGDVEKQSKTLEDIVTNQSNPKVREKTEESSLAQVDGSQTECEEQFEKESEKLPLPEILTEGTGDNVSTVIDKVIDEDEYLRKAELVENEEDTISLLKEDVETEKPLESLHVAPVNIKASNLSHENRTSSPEEHSTNANLHAITSEETEEKKIDAVDVQKEVLESFSTIVSSSPKEASINVVLQGAKSECTDEKTIDEVGTQKKFLENFSTVVPDEEIDENSIIKVDGSETKDEEPLEKESEKMSSPLPLESDANDDESMVMHKARDEDGELRNAELCENEDSTQSILPKIEPRIEKPEDSLNVASEDIKESDLAQEIETRSYIEEQSVTAEPQAILDEKTDERTLNAGEEKEETLENVPTAVSNDKTEQNSLIRVDGKMKNEDHLEKDSEEASSIKDLTGNANDDVLTTMDEVKIEDENPIRPELFQEEKNIECDLGQHKETTGLLKEQSLTESPEGNSGDRPEERTIDSADSNEKTPELQDIAINVSKEDDDKNSLIQVDASQMNHDKNMEKEIEKPSLEEASTKDTPEENIDSTLLKKENLQDTRNSGKESTSSEDIETTCTLEEQSLTAIPQAIISTDTKAVNLEVQNIATEIAHEPIEEDSVIQVDCSQMEHEEHLEKDSENSSLTEAPTKETNDDESKNMHEDIDRDEDLKETEFSEHEKNIVSTLVMEAHVEKPIDSWKAASKDIMGSDLSRDTKVSSIEVQVLSANTQEISSDKREEETIDAAEMKEESFEDPATDIPDGENEDKSSIEEDASQKPSMSDASTGKANDNESTTAHEAKFGDESSTKAYLYENEKSAEGTLVKEEVSIESLKVAAKDIKESALDLDRETSSLEEQSLNANSQETAFKEETHEDKVEQSEKESESTYLTEALIGDNTGSTLFKDEAQVEKPINCLEVAIEAIRASASGQDTETNSTEEQIRTADPQEISCDKTEERSTEPSFTKGKTLEDIAPNVPTGENENNSPIEIDGSERTIVKEAFKEEVSIRSLELSDEDIKASASGQDGETSSLEEQSLTTNPPGIIDDQKEDKPIDTEPPEDKIVATTTPHEDTEKNAMDCQMEQKEHLEKESEDLSPTGDTTESTLKDDALVENTIDSFQVVTEDIKASTSSHDIEEQIPTADPQEISSDKVEEKTIDATYTEEQILEDIVTNFPSGHSKDNSPIEEASKGGTNEDESTITYDAKFVDESLIKADLFENEKNAEGTLLKEEGSADSIQAPTQDIKAYASGQDTETSCLPVQSQTINPQEIIGNHQEDRTTDTTDLKEETPEHKNEHSENESENSSLIEAPTGNTTGSALLKEAHMEKPIDSFEVANEDSKESTSSQETETSSFKEETLTAEPRGTLGDKINEETSSATDMKEETLEVQDNATNVPNGDNEDTSPTEVDGSQKPSLEEASMGNDDDHESINIHEEQSLTANPQGIMGDNKEGETIDLSKVAKEIENVDTRELHEEEIYLRDLHMTTAVDIAAHEEKGSSPIAIKMPSKNVLDIKKDKVVDIDEDPDCKQEESSITEESEEHIIISNDNVENVPSLASEASDPNSDYKIVGEVNSCNENTDTENKGVQDDDSITIPTKENLVETNPEESTVAEAQVPNVEKEAELMQQDPEAGAEEKDIEEELLINASQDVSESNRVNGEEKRNSNNCKEISDSSNSVTLEEVSSSNVASEEDSTPNPSQETRRETHQEAANEEAQKQDEDLHVSVLGQDSSMEKVEKDIQLCLASAIDSDIREEESSPPAPDDSITEKTDPKESEVLEDATKNKDIEHVEQDNTPKSFLDDKKTTVREQEETECGQVLLDETVEETEESTSIPVANDFFPKSFTETSEVDHSTTERELRKDREELQTGKTATDDDEETKNDEVKEEEAGKQKTPDFSSADSNIIEARDKDVDRLLSEAPVENSTWTPKEADAVQETTDTTAVLNKRCIADIETTVDNESLETIETAPTATGGLEVGSTSVRETCTLTSQCERDEYEHACIGSVIEEKLQSDVVEVAPEENKSEYESKNQVLESIAQVQSFEIISKAKETKIEEENLEAAAEIKSEEVVAENILEPKETPYEKETMKVDISSEKFKEEDEDLEDYHLGSCKEEVITEGRPEDEVKPEEEIFEDAKNANETEKVSKVSEEADDKAVEEPEKHLLPNESIDRSLHQKELGKSAEDVTTILDTEEVKSSTVAVLEDENKTGADDNKMAKDERLLNHNSNTSGIDEAAGELPKRLDEYIICEAPPTKAVHETIEDSEGKNEDTNTIMIQHQEEDNKSKHENLPLHEFTQGKESEKQDQKYEICSSEVQVKDEENLTAGEGEEEASGADTWTKSTEDEVRNTFVEAAQLSFSSHTENTSKVLHSDGAQDIPEDNENCTNKSKYSDEKYPNKSTEPQTSAVSEDIELIEQATEDTRTTVEIQKKAGSDSGAAAEATGVDSRQVEEVCDQSKGMAETSTPVELTTISTFEIVQEYTVGTSLETKDQIKLDDLPQESNVRDCEVKMAQKDGPLNLQNVRDISEDVRELNEGSVEVSNKKNLVEVNPSENIKSRVSSEGHEAEEIQKSLVSETLNREIEEQQQGSTSEAVPKARGENCEEDKIIDNKSDDLIENSTSAAAEKVSESNIHQSSMEDTAQSDQRQETERQIDSLPVLPQVKCSDVETAEKDLLMHPAGLEVTDVTKLEVSYLPSKDKHVVLEADDTNNTNPQNSTGNKNISAIQHGDSVECFRGELEVLKPYEPKEANCVDEESTNQETTESREKSEPNEMDKHSLSDLFQVSTKKTKEMAYHSAIEEEPTIHREDLHAEKTDEAEHEDAKSDEAKDDEGESSEQRRSDLGSEAPVMVDMGDADAKIAHKKSHNILSGVGSKVKHSIAKVKKAITGKSSHPKPPSPKQGDNLNKTA